MICVTADRKVREWITFIFKTWKKYLTKAYSTVYDKLNNASQNFGEEEILFVVHTSLYGGVVRTTRAFVMT